jgi:hypothetical protein
MLICFDFLIWNAADPGLFVHEYAGKGQNEYWLTYFDVDNKRAFAMLHIIDSCIP